VAQSSGTAVTRRELVAGLGGLVIGGLGGFLAAGSVPNPTATSGPARSGGDIKVAGVFPLSGIIASDGKEMANGVRMAIDEINAGGGLLGRTITYVEVDDKDSTTDQISTAFQRATSVEKPDAIFSGYHLATGPEFDIVADAGALYYNVNTQVAWTKRYTSNPTKYWSIFQTDPTEFWYGTGFANWVDNALKSELIPAKEKSTAILAGDDAYDTLIATTYEQRMKELGWTVTSKDSFTATNVPDWGPLLSKVRSNPPTVLFTTDYNPADNAAMVKAWAANPAKTILYQQYGPSVPEYLNLAGDASNGVIWATVLGLLTDPLGQDFRTRYQTKYGVAPGWANAGGCYDSVMCWATAVARAGDPKNYKAVAAQTEKLIYRGVTGGISFKDHAGRSYPWETTDPSLGQPHIIVQLQKGQHKIVFPDPYADGKFQLPSWYAA
jgi:branched-chain amino acid transport system substrate-binding protein